ncbi:ParB/Sulfiredoxin [Ochromonadaceae sp. CCMP2298]|nr:ParB/Sulfiredoxin [Ochromonadaceae sp. CCMP2298]
MEDAAPFVGICDNKWKNLKPLMRPTQPEVGFAWISYKVDKDFFSEGDAQNEIESSVTPAVLGPGPAIYIVDDHHTLAALDYSGYDDTKVTVNILCDKRNLSEAEFWISLSAQNLAYLASHPRNQPNSLPTTISYKEMPSTFSFTSASKSMSDDPWRSMAGFSRKVEDAADPAPSCGSSDDKNCERCMFRGCLDGYEISGGGVSFFEFRWSYFMNDATFFDTQYWPSSSDLATFSSLYKALPSAEPSKTNTDDWFAAANYVISLCRSPASAGYELPSDIFPGVNSTPQSRGGQTLPGYVQDYLKLDSDPTCDAPTCRA